MFAATTLSRPFAAAVWIWGFSIWIVLPFGPVGCGSDRETPPPSENPPAPQPSTAKKTGSSTAPPKKSNATPLPTRRDAAAPSTSAVDSDAVLNTLLNGKIVHLKPLSARSFSLKITFENGEKAVFKPMLKDDWRARYEVAAFRMAELLRIDGVPVAVMRSLSAEFIAVRLERNAPERAKELRARANPDDRGRVPGAVISWVTDIDRDGLKALGGKPTLMKWLSLEGPSPNQDPLAVQASRMVAFDYVIGNWDRFSGGNLFLGTAPRRLVLIDHNGAFHKWADVRQEKMSALLRRVERFSTRFVRDLRKLAKPDIETALLRDARHSAHPLLTPAEIDLILLRRDQVLAHVDRLIQTHGRDAVLALP